MWHRRSSRRSQVYADESSRATWLEIRMRVVYPVDWSDRNDAHAFPASAFCKCVPATIFLILSESHSIQRYLSSRSLCAASFPPLHRRLWMKFRYSLHFAVLSLISLSPPPSLFWTLLIQCIVIPELNDKEGSGGPREEELKRTSRLIEINSKDCGRLGTTSLRRFYLLPSSRSNAASCSAKCRSRFLLRHILLQEIPLK